MERRYIQQQAARVALAERQDAGPQIVGYAAVYYDGMRATEYELWKGVWERIMPGAFDRAIAQDDVRGLLNHNPDQLLARKGAGTLALKSDDRGLFYTINPGDTQPGRDVVQHVRRGDLVGSSFSFNVVDERWREEGDLEIREILGVELWDVGPVTFAAYDGTTTGLRSGDGMTEAKAAHEGWRTHVAEVNRWLAAVRARAVEVAD